MDGIPMEELDTLIERLRAFASLPLPPENINDQQMCRKAADALAKLQEDLDHWRKRSNENFEARKEAQAEIAKLQDALRAILDHYVTLASSGDCGFWDCEKEDIVIATRSALGGKP